MNAAKSLLDRLLAYIEKSEPYPGLPESQPLLVRKLAGRAATLASGFIAAKGGPFSGFAQVLAGILAMGLAESVTDFWARAKVSPAWKLAAAYRAGAARALEGAGEQVRKARDFIE